MPRVYDWKGYRFFFYSNEGSPLEPVHIHVRKDQAVAKFWLDPDVTLSNSWGFASSELNKLAAVVNENSDLIRSKWHEHFRL